MTQCCLHLRTYQQLQLTGSSSSSRLVQQACKLVLLQLALSAACDSMAGGQACQQLHLKPQQQHLRQQQQQQQQQGVMLLSLMVTKQAVCQGYLQMYIC
jgi:hypothetical protein